MAIEFYQRAATNLVRDDASRIAPEDVDAAIHAAVARYSGERPRSVVADLVTVAGPLQATPPDWVAAESLLVSAEYPVDEVPPAYLPDGAVVAIDQPDGTQRLGFADALPEASTVRLRFTAPHLVDGQRDTIPPQRRMGIALLAAATLCGQLASAYANQTNSTIGADAVEHKSKSELWAGRERQYLRQAEAALGIALLTAATAAAEPAGTVVSFAPRRGNRLQRGLRMF